MPRRPLFFYWVIDMPATIVQELEEQLAELDANIKAAMEVDDEETFDKYTAEREKVAEKHAKYKAHEDAAQASVSSTKNKNTDVTIGKIKDSWQDDPKLGYKSHRDFLLDVTRSDAMHRQHASPQVASCFSAPMMATAGSDEQSTQSDRYGGYLIPEGFRPDLLKLGMEADPTVGRVTNIPMTTPTLKLTARTDKDHSSSVSGGLTVSRRVETQQPTSSRMEIERISLDVTGQFGLAYTSEEVLERSPISFVSLLEMGFRDEYASAGFDEKINGDGAGGPEGILNSLALISVTRNTTNEIRGIDIVNMRTRAYRYGRRYIWMANHDCYPQLVDVNLAASNSDNWLFHHGNGTDVPDTLVGLPIFFTEYCAAMGTVGDILLVDWSQYLWATYGRDMRSAESIHVRFLNHERTFKFWTYNDGRCWWRSVFTPKNGANTLSPFVALAT